MIDGASPICLLTGASGFVGANLAPMLATRYRLRCLVRPGQELPALRDTPHERIEGTLTDTAALQRGVHGADVVVHLAALVSFRREDHAAMFAINRDATAVLARAAREAGVRRFLHMSTISAVGYGNGELLDETSPYNFGPLHIGYCDSKRAGEDAVLAEAAAGLPAVVVNPPSMYGAGDRRKGEGSLITSVLRGRIPFAPPGGINVADVLDICRGCLQAIDSGRAGERYILGGENLTGAQLLQRVAAVVGGRAPRRTLPKWVARLFAAAVAVKERFTGSRPPLTAEILRLAPCFLWYSSAKAQRELGYSPGPVDPGIAAAWRELQDASSRT